MLALVVLASALPASRASATVHVCTGASGSPVFQDRPCERRTPVADAPRATLGRAPAGLHESWFARPEGAEVIARCDDGGCRCDALTRPFDSGLELAVADALYLDGAWHRFDEAMGAHRRDAFDGPPPETLERHVDEAACDVLISQRILRTHARDVLAELRRRAREAEERGYDDGVYCNAGDPIACDSLDALQLYRRMLTDLVALRMPREGTADPTAPAISAADRSSR